MKILHISDTHSKHNQLQNIPEADVIVHSGDFTWAGNDGEAYDFMNWFCDLPHKHKVFISGNHDVCMYGANAIEGLPDNVHYLCNSSIIIEGLKFYGVPLFMEDCVSGIYNKQCKAIPLDTNILITHQPPRAVCDLADYGNGPAHHGSPILAQRVAEVKPKFHLFGHEHDANDTLKVGNTVYSNAALLDHEYNMVYKPRLFVIHK